MQLRRYVIAALGPAGAAQMAPMAPLAGSLLEDRGDSAPPARAQRQPMGCGAWPTRRSAAPMALTATFAPAADFRSPAPLRRRFSAWPPRQESAHCSRAAAERPLGLSELRFGDVEGGRSRSDRSGALPGTLHTPI